MEPIVIKQSVNSNVIYILGAIILCILSFALVFEDFRSSFDNTLIEGIIPSLTVKKKQNRYNT